jgi:penicillin-binding protein 1C
VKAVAKIKAVKAVKAVKAGCGLAAVLLATAVAALPSFDEVRAAHAPSDLPLLDRHGDVLQLLRVDASVRRGPWLGLADISPALRQALVLSEDRRFWDHGGVDWRALAGGAWATAWNHKTRGASTLTMQLAGLTDTELARPASGRSLSQKVSQLWRAQQLESRWQKAQILEAYLNRVPLRGELVGVAAASNQLFDKHASGLDSVEAALLAAMVRAPNARADTIERRACEILRQQKFGCEGLGITLSQALARRPGPLKGGAGTASSPIAAHLGQRFLQNAATPMPADSNRPMAFRSTLDAPLQRVALAALQRQLAELRGRNVEDGAVVVLDNTSGDVLAWVGSSGPIHSQAPEVDAVLARRQPGSTIKPFVYALALQQRLITASSRLDDSPLQLAAGVHLYVPQNYDQRFKGPVSARTALASSLNVPAVRVGAMLGPEALFAKLNGAGLRLTESAGFHGHALALGSAEVNLLDLANAYRMLANGGQISPVRWQLGGPAAVTATAVASSAGSSASGPSSRQVFDKDAVFIVADMLADPAARATTFGLDSPLVTRGWAAVKTGTSKDLRDNWCIGFTNRFTVGVWVGNAGGAPMHGVSGVSGAAPVWRDVVAYLHRGDGAGSGASRAPAPPPGLVQQAGEWFVPGTEPGPMVATGADDGPRGFGVYSPRQGSVIVLDPDIPISAQRLVLEGAPGQWRINGRVVGQGRSVTWLPRVGAHVLEWRATPSQNSSVVMSDGLERVAFEVRAAPPAVRPKRR